MSAMPAHVVAHLIEQGHLDKDGVGRRAKFRTCHCGALVVAGLDDDRCGMTAVCDPAPLDPLGELAALLQGRLTFDLARRRDRYQLDHRDAWNITGSPAGTKEGTDVVADHKCGAAPLNSTTSRISAPRRTTEATECPF